MKLRTSGLPPKDWTKVPTSELVAEVVKITVGQPHLVPMSRAAKELDRRLPVPDGNLP